MFMCLKLLIMCLSLCLSRVFYIFALLLLLFSYSGREQTRLFLSLASNTKKRYQPMFKNFKETVIFNADEMINGDDAAFLIRRNPQVNNMALEKCGQQSL